MIPGFDLIQFAQTAGPLAALLVVMLIIFAENGLLIGFFFPGDSILFTVGVLVQGTNSIKLDFDINLVIGLLFLAAIIGASVGYEFGKRIGPRLFKRPDSLLFRKENVQKAQKFYDKYGGKTIIIARFVPVVRTFVPLIAGIAKMEYKTFLMFNILGGALWVAGITYLGYFMGAWLNNMGIDVDTILLPIIAIILIASISPALYQLLKEKERRQNLYSAIKSQWQQIIKRKK